MTSCVRVVARSGWAALSVLVACGGAVTPTDTVAERFDSSEAESARTRAPDMYAAAARARRDAQRAEQAGDLAASADHATRARLLLAAAVEEADRLELEEQRLAAESAERAAEEQRVRDETARVGIERGLAHREAARVAAEQAAAAYQRAAQDEGRRYRAQEAEREQLRRDAARVLARRAQLLVAAAQAMDAEGPAIVRVATLIAESSAAPDGVGAMEKAQQAVREAMAALGMARAGSDAPTGDERAALIAAAQEAGFEVEQSDRGLIVRLSHAFRGNGAQLDPRAARQLPHLAALVTAHPHGRVQAVAFAAGAHVANRERLADTRAAAIASALAHEGAPEDRLSPEGTADAGEDPDSVDLVFLAYGPA